MEANIKWICWVVNQRNVLAKERKSLRNRRRSYKSLSEEAIKQNELYFEIVNHKLSELSKKYTKELRRKLKAMDMKLLDNRDAGYSGILYNSMNNKNSVYLNHINVVKIAEYAREYEAELAIMDALKIDL